MGFRGQVWYVAETSLPGLNAEAATVEGLVQLLPAMAQDLLDEAGAPATGTGDDLLSLEVTAHTRPVFLGARLD